MRNIEAMTELNWVIVILGFFVILVGIREIIELISYFKKKFRIKTGRESDQDTTENRINTLEEHDKWQYNRITEIIRGIDDIKNIIKDSEKHKREETVAILRNQLYSLHKSFIKKGYVDESGLKTFLELGKIYEEAGGNDIYHDKLKPEVMKLPIKEDN